MGHSFVLVEYEPVGTHGDPIQTHFDNIRTLFGTWAKVLNLDGLKIKGQILKILLVWPTVPTADLGNPKFTTWTAATHPSIKESTKGGGRRRRPLLFLEAARSVASFMDGCAAAIQVEDFGLPKSAVGTVGQTSKIFRI